MRKVRCSQSVKKSFPCDTGAVFNLFKTLLSAKIRKRFSVHSSLDKLVTKLGGVDILPQEYGGRKPLADMTREWAGELQEKRSSLLGM